MKKVVSIILLVCLCANICQAIPARRKPMTVKQPDGTEVNVILTGDEFFHYYTTVDGFALYKEKDGSFTYARQLTDKTLEGSNLLAHNMTARTTTEKEFLQSYGLTKVVESESSVLKRSKANSRRVGASRAAEINPKGHAKIPVLFVTFKGYPTTISKEVMQLHFTGVNYKGDYEGSNGSAKDYFVAQSDSLFIPQFDVYGPVTLPNKMSYYGANLNGKEGEDIRPEEMLKDACKLLDSEIDFSEYDNDGDGEVEFIYIVYAGYSEASQAPDTTIWPHQWALSEATGSKLTLDNTKIDTYCCSSELFDNSGKQIDGIGPICHEFSHCLGLPDFYDTGDNNYFGLDYWSIMDYGCYNLDGFCPVGYSAYERDFVGWKELVTLDEASNVTLNALNKGGAGYRIVNDANKNEYYIVENRQQTEWDTYLFNHGMLIFHVDYSASAWNNNTVNNVGTHQRMTLIPADNKLISYYDASTSKEYTNSLKGDPWPGSTGNRSLTDFTTPAAKVFTGAYMSKPITDITELNGVITFKFMGGKIEDLPAPVIDETNTTEVSTNSFKLAWDAVPDAESYLVELSVKNDTGFALIKSFPTASTTYSFAGLADDGVYRYRIMAVSGAVTSDWSDAVVVTLSPSLIESVREDGASFSITAQGSEVVVKATTGTVAEVYTIGGVLNKKATTANGTATIHLSKGLYIIRIGDKAQKVYIK